jgi:adenylate cyclase
MAELLAQGKDPSQRWRQTLSNQPLTLGRTADSVLQVPWDRKISRVHASLLWQNGVLLVRRLPISLNPIFFQGAAAEEFQAPPGGRFVIGDTTFIVVGDQGSSVPDMPLPSTELTCSPEELRQYKYIDADERIEVLAALPAVIRFSPSEAELETQVAAVLLRGIPRAEDAAVLRLQHPPGGRDPVIELRIVRNRQGLTDKFRPSRRLVLEAMERRHQSVMHIWQKGEANQEFTVQAGCNWAICTPLNFDPDRVPDLSGFGDTNSSPTPQGTGENLALYLTGSLPTADLLGPRRDDLLKSDLKFTELVADMFNSLRQQGDMQRRLGQFKTFLPRPVIDVLAGMAGKDMEDYLKPRPAQVTVLFCDIRGSCRIAEQGQNDLMRLWDHVCAALGIMSSNILEQDGVIGDFQGDAIMAFWGWPPADASGESSSGGALAMERALRAALAISQQFAEQPPHSPLGQIRCGIGVAHGPAVVGRLGTPDQFKIGVFGPTVNLAARLESLTKRFGVSILVDDACGAFLRDEAPRLGGQVRRLARIQPAGMTQNLEVAELVAEKSETTLQLGQKGSRYEAALTAFQQGRWEEARPLLESMTSDGPAAFLLQYMQRWPDGPPAGWNGLIVLDSK